MIIDEILRDITKNKTDRLIWLILFTILIISGYYKYGLKGITTPLILVIGFLGTLGGIAELYFLITEKQKISKTSYILFPLTIVLYVYLFVTEHYMAVAIFALPSLFIFIFLI